jgi:competence protein ComEA
MGARAEAAVTFLLIALCLGLTAWNLYPRLSVRRIPITHERPDITVSVAGAVAYPGVYALPWGSRVEDAVAEAGGFTDAAEETLLNLADPLTTGEAVLVPETRTATGENRLSLNTATERELDLLIPGVGPSTAAKIVAARPFSSVDDLLDVSGIGPATLEKIRPFVKP